MVKLPIYLDYHATTPVDPRVVEAMTPYFTEHFGNAASRSHAFGWRAAEAVEIAREQIARSIGAEPEEIVFTSGATESNNLAIAGAADANAFKGRHVITGATEHKAALDVCRALERKGWRVTYLPVDGEGFVELDRLRAAITEKTVLVSLMYANNEIGAIQDIETIGAICRERGILFHTDAAQAAGKIFFNVASQHVDLASLSAHKMYGPKGVGALYIRRAPRVRLAEQIHGGGHERGMRSGTLNVPGIVGFGVAAQIAAHEMIDEAVRTRRLRDMLWNAVRAGFDGAIVNGPDPERGAARRLPGNLNVSFTGVSADALMMDVKTVAVSSGSACSSASPEPSHVLAALGAGEARARAAIRFGVGRFSTEEEIAYAAAEFARAANRLRERADIAMKNG